MMACRVSGAESLSVVEPPSSVTTEDPSGQPVAPGSVQGLLRGEPAAHRREDEPAGHGRHSRWISVYT
jgi:hypothetical protein